MLTTSPSSNGTVRIVFDEAVGASAREATRSIARLERSGQSIAHAEILVGGKSTSTAVERLEQRTTLAVALVRHMARAGSGELTFVADATSSRSLRSELLALVDTLLTTMGSRGVGLHVQFGGIGDSH
jgi:hypothetical protein